MARNRAAAARLVAVLVAVGAALEASPSPAQAPTSRDITQFACPADLIAAPFTDIDGSAHETAIICLATYGITQGTSETKYSPTQFVRRGQMARFLFRLLESQGVPMDLLPRGFNDITGHPHEEAINAIAAVGVAQGRTATQFAPESLIRRGEMATFLIRVADLFGPPMPAGADAFSDDNGTRHEASINAVAAAGIAQGVGGGRFDPDGGVTRAAMASFIMRLLDWGIESFSMSSFAGDRIAAAALIPGEVTGGGTTGASGLVVLVTIGMDDVLCFGLGADALGGAATAAHLHKAAATAAPSVALTLPPPTAQDSDFPTSDVASGRCVLVARTLLSDVTADPEAYYVDVHTTTADPAIGGQLGDKRSELVAQLEGSAEVPGPGDPDGFGFAAVDATTQPDDLCFFIIVDGIAPPATAHIHRGGAGVAGSIVVPLKGPTRTPVPGVFTANGCLGGLDPTLVSEVAASPSGFYVEVHNPEFPDGAVRGQLAPESAAAAGLRSSGR